MGLNGKLIEKELIEIERCDPFGCETEVGVDIEAYAALNKEKPLGRFNGFKTYTDRNHLAVNELSEGWKKSKTFAEFSKNFMNLPFYKALIFTLTYTFFVTPLVWECVNEFVNYLSYLGVHDGGVIFRRIKYLIFK